MSGKTNSRKGLWGQTSKGERFYPWDPRPEEVTIEDIASSLSKLCRYNGHTTAPYSVAEHSVLVAHAAEHVVGVADPDLILAVLLHDAHEAYIGDVPLPLKAGFGPEWKALERAWDVAVGAAFSLDPALFSDPIVKVLDRAALWAEAKVYMPGPLLDEWELSDEDRVLGERLLAEGLLRHPTGEEMYVYGGKPWTLAKAEFLNAYRRLSRAR